MKLPTAVTRATGSTKLYLNRNAPTIMTVAGVAGFAATTALAVHATLKASERLPKIKREIESTKEIQLDENTTEQDRVRFIAHAYGEAGAELVKIYGPTLLAGSFSTALVLSAHGMMRHRQASLLAAYAALDAGYKAYRKRVIEHLGEEKELKLYRGVKTLELKGEEGPPCIIDPLDVLPSPYARFFDEYSRNWSKTPEYNLMFLRSQQDWANDRLHAYGFLFLNEVYEALGLERSQAGQTVGWKLKGNGDGFVDFGLYNMADETGRAFINGLEASVLLDFNVDGPIRI